MTEGLARKLIWGALRGRGCSPVGKNPEPDVPCQGDVLCILDGGRDSPALMSPFKQGKGPGYLMICLVCLVCLMILFDEAFDIIDSDSLRSSND